MLAYSGPAAFDRWLRRRGDRRAERGSIPLIEAIEVVEITPTVLSRASQPLPTTLGTLDAIHLATTILWKERAGKDIAMATHDLALAVAAKASGLRVIGA